MKISKGRLKQLIMEEMSYIEEGGEAGHLEPVRSFDRLFEKGAAGDVFAEAVANELMLDEEEDFQAMRGSIQGALVDWYRRHQSQRYPAGATPGAPMQETNKKKRGK